jgi:hypothetical protein
MGQLDDALLQALLQPEATFPSYFTGHPWNPDAAAGSSFNTAAVLSAAAAQAARLGGFIQGSYSRQHTGISGGIDYRQPTHVQQLALPAAAESCNITAGFAPAPFAAAAVSAFAGGPGPADLLLTLQQPAMGTAAGGGTTAASAWAKPSPKGIAVQSGMQDIWATASTAKEPQQQQQQLLASQLSDDEWDLLLPPLPAPLLQQQQQQQQALLDASACVPAATPSPPTAAATAGPASYLFGSSNNCPGGWVNVAGVSSCGDVLAFAHGSISRLLQLSVRLMSRDDSCCSLPDFIAWMIQARKQLEAEAAAGSSSRAILQLLSQIMLLLSSELADVEGRGVMSYQCGVLAARPGVQALVDQLIAALANLGDQVFTAVRAAAASSVTQQMVGSWIAGLQQQAASGSAVDRSVLKLCSALVQG